MADTPTTVQAAGATTLVASTSILAFIEAHPTFVSAVGIACGLAIQAAGMIWSNKRRAEIDRLKESLREEQAKRLALEVSLRRDESAP